MGRFVLVRPCPVLSSFRIKNGRAQREPSAGLCHDTSVACPPFVFAFALLSFATELERGIDNYPLTLEGCDEREDALPPRHDIRIRPLGVPGSVHIQS